MKTEDEIRKLTSLVETAADELVQAELDFDRATRRRERARAAHQDRINNLRDFATKAAAERMSAEEAKK